MAARLRLAALAALLVPGLLAGCGGPAPESAPEAATDETPAAAAEAAPSPAIAAGLEALQNGDLDAAREAYAGVAPGSPDFPAALRGLGIVAMKDNDIPAAISTLETLITFQPASDDAWVLYARALFRDGRPEDAETAALRAIELNSDRADVRYDVALYRLEQDRLAEAIGSYERAMLVDLDGSAASAAYSNVASLREDDPADPDLAYAAAFFANALDDAEAERTALEAYLELAPEGPAAPNARARLATLDGGG